VKRGKELFIFVFIVLVFTMDSSAFTCESYDSGPLEFIDFYVSETGNYCDLKEEELIVWKTDCTVIFETPNLTVPGEYFLSMPAQIGSSWDVNTENFSLTCGGVTHHFYDDNINGEEHYVDFNVSCLFEEGFNQVTINSTADGSVHLPYFNITSEEDCSCGNGNVDFGEECDDGANNGNICTPNPIYGEGISCSYCTNECNLSIVNAQNCTDGIHNGDEIRTDCGGETCVGENEFCSAISLGVNYCWDYDTYGEGHCLNYDEIVANNSVENLGPYQKAECVWTNAKCEANIINHNLDGVPIGTCLHVFEVVDATCEDGFYLYDWEGSFAWDPDNYYYFEDPDNIPAGFVHESGTLYHYDPFNATSTCTFGRENIPCPAQVVLPYFNIKNFIGAAFILLIYYFARHKKITKFSKD
jgi:hypothetical protein